MDLKLLYAASNGTTDDILRLLSQGYDVNQQQFRQQKNHMSCELTNLKRELQRGETIHPESHNADSALHRAALMNRRENMDLLLQKGALLTAKNDRGEIPLHCPACSGSVECLADLLKRDPPLFTCRSKQGWALLHYGVKSESVEMVKYLVGLGADITAVCALGETPLIHAGYGHSLEIVKFLLGQQPFLLDAKNSLGVGLLYNALKSGDVEKMHFFLSIGATVNTRTHPSQTPFFQALSMSSIEHIITLIDHGADLDSVYPRGETYLIHASRRTTDRKAVVALLLETSVRQASEFFV